MGTGTRNSKIDKIRLNRLAQLCHPLCARTPNHAFAYAKVAFVDICSMARLTVAADAQTLPL